MRLTFTHLRFLITYRKLNTEFNQKIIKSHFNSSTLAYKFLGSVFLSPTKADTKNIKSFFQAMSTVRKVTPYLIRIIIFVVIGSTTERLRGGSEGSGFRVFKKFLIFFFLTFITNFPFFVVSLLT